MSSAFKITASSQLPGYTHKAQREPPPRRSIQEGGQVGVQEWANGGVGCWQGKALTPATGDLGEGNSLSKCRMGSMGCSSDRQRASERRAGAVGGFLESSSFFAVSWGNPASLRGSSLIPARKPTSRKPKTELGDNGSPAWNKAGSPFGIRRRQRRPG